MCRLDRHAGLQPSDREQHAHIAVVDEIRFARNGEPFDGRHDRDPHIRPLGIRECRWHDPDDRVQPAAEKNGSSNGADIAAELPPPESVAQHDCTCGAAPVVGRRQRATKRRPRAEHVEEVA